MARPKAFEKDIALAKAKMVFWQKGYSATTTEDLRLAMGIGRQSFYDTFGDKHEIFLEVLRLYNTGRSAKFSQIIQKSSSPLGALEAILMDLAEEDSSARELGCLGIASVCEFGVSDPKVAQANQSAGAVWKNTFENLIEEAKAAKEVRSSVDTAAAANFLQAMMAGLRILSKGGARPRDLRDTVRIAVNGLKA